MTELLLGVVVAIASLALVLEPLVRGRGWSAAGETSTGDELDIDFTDVEESESPKIRALLAIKEIEFDRETGKLSDEDYADLKATYQRAALTAIEKEEAGEHAPDDGQNVVAICPACGPRPESVARFCSDCGRPVEVPGDAKRCSGCGVSAPPGAKFCSECGGRL